MSFRRYLGDARDAARNKRARALAATTSEAVAREPPLVAPALLLALCVVLVPALRIGALQFPAAVATMIARPGALSARGLAL